MNVSALNSSIWDSFGTNGSPSAPSAIQAAENGTSDETDGDKKLRKTFQDFVGETLFSQMLKAARKTQNKPAYFHGGRAEEMFQQQLDQVLSEKIANSNGAQYSDAMYELFTLKRG